MLGACNGSALILSTALLFTACNSSTERARPEGLAPSASGATPAADDGFCEAAPSATVASCGSDWCEEHGVAEADCVPCKERGGH